MFRTFGRESLPSSSTSRQHKKQAVSSNAWKDLDRVQVLEGDYGHDGCVNALSWIDGETLASSGDDLRVHLWRMDADDEEYNFDCAGIIRTGHRSNIFNVKLLPSSSSHIVTCARDGQVRVFDASRARQPPTAHDAPPITLSADDACIRVLRCHDSDVKRLVVDGPSQFMSVSEDGTVRHHDLRQPHTCSRHGGTCPAPLINTTFGLDALTMSALRPHYLVVAGESPHGFLYDRRGSVRNIQEVTTCVRRFGRATRGRGETQGSEHITGARLSDENSEELILSYHADAVYLYSIFDDPADAHARRTPKSTTPSRKRRRVNGSAEDVAEDEDADAILNEASDSSDDEWVDESDDEQAGNLDEPQVMPRTRYVGACNIQTIKDVNFLGHRDEYVVSGSDDGNWFMWHKDGELAGIWEGDGSVVNVIESHPSLPLVATSGIDETVKIFAPTPGRPKEYSRMSRLDDIVAHNSTHRPSAVGLLTPMDLMRYRLLWSSHAHGTEDEVSDCRQQ